MPMVKISRARQAAGRAAEAARRKQRAETATYSGAARDNNPIGHPPSDPWPLDFHAERSTDWALLDCDDRWSND